MPAIRRVDPTVRTVLHAGDFWPTPSFLATVDFWARNAGIDKVLVTLGNHEPWGEIAALQAQHPGLALRVSSTVWLLPRPFRFTVGARSVLSLGGAASVDADWRVPGVDWWPDERIMDEMVDEAIAGGRADFMVTHETPEFTPVNAVRNILSLNPLGFPASALAKSMASRGQVQRVCDVVEPEMLFHGHMHAPGEGTLPDGRQVISLGCDGQPGSTVLLRVESLETTNVIVR